MRRAALGVTLLALLGIPNVVLAYQDVWTSGFPPTIVQNIKWIPDPSISSTYVANYIDPGPGKWNGISSRVKVSKGTSTSYNVRYVLKTTNDPTLPAKTFPYCTAGNGEACKDPPGSNHVWTAAQIQLYENVIINARYTTQGRVALTTHEFGHALSLSHIASTVPSVMPQQVTSNHNPSPQSVDIANLKYKWGN
jgi:hypothetical protein